MRRPGSWPDAATAGRNGRRETFADIAALSPSIGEELAGRSRSSGALLSWMAALVVLAWALVDRVLEPASAGLFLTVRLIGDVPMLAATWLLLGTRIGRRRPEICTFAALAVVQVEVGWMIPGSSTSRST